MSDSTFTWRHAFAYADCRISTDDSCEYASWYEKMSKDEWNDLHDGFPAHSKVFYDWVTKNGKEFT